MTIEGETSTTVTAIKAKTDLLPADTSTQLDTNIPAVKAKTDLIPADNATQLDTNVPAIKAKTDLLPADVATQLDTNVPAIKAKTDLLLPGTKLITKTSTSALTSGTLFNIAGSVQILQITGRVTTIIQSQATNVKLSLTMDSLTAKDICANLDINGFAVGSLLGISGTLTDAMLGATGVAVIAPQAAAIVAACITSGILTVTFGAASTGAIVWEVLWIPLNAAGSITAA
jgi:hypothetical protein